MKSHKIVQTYFTIPLFKIMQTYLKCTYESAELTPTCSCFRAHLPLLVMCPGLSTQDKEGCTSGTQSVVVPFCISMNAIESPSRWLKKGDALCWMSLALFFVCLFGHCTLRCHKTPKFSFACFFKRLNS